MRKRTSRTAGTRLRYCNCWADWTSTLTDLANMPNGRLESMYHEPEYCMQCPCCLISKVVDISVATNVISARRLPVLHGCALRKRYIRIVPTQACKYNIKRLMLFAVVTFFYISNDFFIFERFCYLKKNVSTNVVKWYFNDIFHRLLQCNVAKVGKL